MVSSELKTSHTLRIWVIVRQLQIPLDEIGKPTRLIGQKQRTCEMSKMFV